VYAKAFNTGAEMKIIKCNFQDRKRFPGVRVHPGIFFWLYVCFNFPLCGQAGAAMLFEAPISRCSSICKPVRIPARHCHAGVLLSAGQVFLLSPYFNF
jgi:hypothetical protein